MKVAIIGGAFNPVTLAHKEISRVLQIVAPELDQVWYLPTGAHPFQKSYIFEHSRLHILSQTLGKNERICNLELEQGMSGKTFDTVQAKESI